MKNVTILEIFVYCVKLGLKTTKAVQRTIFAYTIQNWLTHFKWVGFDLPFEMKPSSGQPTFVDDDTLKHQEELNPIPSIQNFSECLESSNHIEQCDNTLVLGE